MRDHFPKSLQHLGRVEFDLVINMSGETLPDSLDVSGPGMGRRDPVRMKFSAHCAVRDEIERLVMSLILELRREQAKAGLATGHGRVDSLTPLGRVLPHVAPRLQVNRGGLLCGNTPSLRCWQSCRSSPRG